MDNQVWLEGAKQRFDFNAWPCPSEKSAQFRTKGFSLNIKHIAETWHLERRIPYGDNGYADYFENVENDKYRIMVRVSEYSSHDKARLALLNEISFSTAMTLPRLDSLGIEVGDVGFTGHGDIPTSIVFVRHNILVDIRSIGEEPISVMEFSQLVDNNIQDASISINSQQ